MEEKNIYIPKQYFYIILVFFIIITSAIFLDLYLIGTSFYDLVIISIFILIFVAILIFSYLSYKEKVPYLVEYNFNLYASKHQVILTTIIFVFLFILALYMYYIERSIVSLITGILLIIIGIVSIIYVYLSYKKKIPLLKLK